MMAVLYFDLTSRSIDGTGRWLVSVARSGITSLSDIVDSIVEPSSVEASSVESSSVESRTAGALCTTDTVAAFVRRTNNA